MCRFLACGNVKRFAHSLIQKQKTSCLEVLNIEPHWTVGSPFSTYRFYLYYRLLLKRTFFTSCKAKNFYAFRKHNVDNQCAQVVQNRISQTCFYSVPALPPIGQIARAVSLALSRSNLIVPGIVAFIIGELAWTPQTWAEAESFPPRDSLYMHAQDGQLYLTTALFYVLEVFILFFRAIYLAILFSPCITMSPFVDFVGIHFRKRWLHVVRLSLELAGPAFIKWGQWAATRPDLFPKDLCAELAKLHTKAPSHKFAYSRKSIENAFGRKLHEIFENFDEEPVASGSIAQVHRATLKYRYPGQKIKPIVVAVKVRHPGVSQAIRRDFVILNLVAKISKFFPNLKWLRLDESLQQFAVFMMSQVDLSREAAHLSRFIYNFRRWNDVSFPKPLYPLVHPSVLVETYEQGESVLHYVDELEGHEQIKTTLSHIGTHALLKMLLVDNFIHADMHPGNILVRVTESRYSQIHLFKSKPHVIFLDVGMITELSKREQRHLLEFFKAVAFLDGRTAAECTLRLSKQQTCPNPKSFVEDVEKSFSLWRSKPFHPADCMQQLLEHVRQHRVNLDGNICSVVVTILVLEGWQRRLDPAYNVLLALQSMLFKADWAESMSYTIERLMGP
ncbi:putative serine/threonine-protein kinase abkC isoform X1 [Senna tora]|uniref:Putative serine/threonine-protein kinase abkC isoform X1 n=1 Tax=Senna tora TaxID=362788 RepID=A0A834X1V4_9FABA|nr:putative serine/threonine-protein kinase abkC isoform X1 [Senna tora]